MSTRKAWGFIAFALMFVLQSAQADLVWNMGITNYTDGAAVPFTTFTTWTAGGLTNDQFSSVNATTSLTLTADEYQAGEFRLKVGLGSTSARNLRVNAGLTTSHTLIIASSDFSGADSSANTVVTLNAASTTGTRPSGGLATTSYTNGNVRMTMVVNRTGSAILLPTGDSLESGYVANYLKYIDGTYGNYTASALTLDVQGFMVTAGTSPSTATATLYLDNIGLWASTDGSVDTWGGKSVLDLSYGTAIPEPASVGLIALGSALVLLIRKFRA